MRRKLMLTMLAGAALTVVASTDAFAGSVLTATIRDNYENAGGKLKGSWEADFSGVVGSNTATLNGQFNVSGGRYANWFGGSGASAALSATLTNFQSTVTGTSGINTQSQFGGDIFAEAASYVPSTNSWNPTEYISFDFGELYIEGVGGAYAAVGRGSTSPTVGKIYNYNGDVLVNFWLNRITFNSPRGRTKIVSDGDWITVVLQSGTSGGGDPVPEPSTYAMMALGLLGLGGWMRRKRKLRGTLSGTAADVAAADPA